MTASKLQGWHVANWGLYGWIETALKGIALIIGLAAALSTPDAPLMLDGHPRLLAVLLLIGLSLGTLVQVTFRVIQREVISILFAVLNTGGHFGLVLALLRDPALQIAPLLFCGFYLLGELAKQRFLRTTGYVEGGLDSAAIIRTSLFLALVYVALILLFVV
ncbi:MAG: hypothetical protein IPM16_13830 [Chloroflexi bacterium]|nr:hypothetical protein [Chloroflexota bacterium]